MTETKRLKEMLFLWWLCLCAELPASRPKCIFDKVQANVRLVRAAPPQQKDVFFEGNMGGKNTSMQSHRRVRETEQPQPIRIRTWFTEKNHHQSEESDRLETAVEEAIGTVASLLSVTRVPGPLLLKRDFNKYCKFLWRNSSSLNYNRCGRVNKTYRNETCLDVTIPDEHLEGCFVYPEPDSSHGTVVRPEGAGLPDTDFLLYLHVRSTDKCRAEPNVQAYAVHCQTDVNGRPLAGVVVICRGTLPGSTYSHHATVQTLIHEMFHALGFSKTLFSSWRDCSTSARCSLRAKMVRSDTSGQMRIYTQSVTSALQKHLKTTDTNVGGPLENKTLGSTGTGLVLVLVSGLNMGGKEFEIHAAKIWKSLPENDAGPSGVSSHWESRLMQGSIMAAVLDDPLTVRIDLLTLAALQDTGWYTANLERTQQLVWGEGEGNEFGSLLTCKQNSAFFCSGSGFGCHYLHLHKGQCQSDPYLDGCRIYKPIKNGSQCWMVENVQESSQDEMFGSDGRCFVSSLSSQGGVLNTSTVGRCYRHRCTGLNQYQIHVRDSDWVNCPAGGAVQIKGYAGSVWCPDRRLCVPNVSHILYDQSKFQESFVVWSMWRTSALFSALGLLASLFFLLLLVSVSCRCCKVRVHSLQQEQHMPPTRALERSV